MFKSCSVQVSDENCSMLLYARHIKIMYLGLALILSLLSISANILVTITLTTKHKRPQSLALFRHTTIFLQQNTILADSLQAIYLIVTLLFDQYFGEYFPFVRVRWLSGKERIFGLS